MFKMLKIKRLQFFNKKELVCELSIPNICADITGTIDCSNPTAVN